MTFWPHVSDAAVALDIMRLSRALPGEAERAGRARFAALVAHARAHSPFYRRHYRGLSESAADPAAFPSTDKTMLMGAFNHWAADGEYTLQSLSEFCANRKHIGHLYGGRVAVWRSSGTSGIPGIFLHDRGALATYDLLFALRAWDVAGLPFGWVDTLMQGGRMACIVATEDHFAAISSWRRLATQHPALGTLMRDYSVMQPLGEIVAALNSWRPAQIAAYPSVLALLAAERDSGRLDISPVLLHSGGECLSERLRMEIEAAFDAPVRGVYASSECDYIAFGCGHGNYHVNADWVLLEPVDAEGRPVDPGKPSHTALVTNLANRVQPIIRYDIGDSITRLAEACPCGHPLPAIRVEGRREEVLWFKGSHDRCIAILPMAITTAVELVDDGIRRFRIVRDGEASLRVDCEFETACDQDAARSRVSHAVAGYLAAQSLSHVAVQVFGRKLVADPESGKFRQVVSAFEGA